MSETFRDIGASVERARSGLSAASALVASAKPGERKQWLDRERWWKIQLDYALKREQK